jgi:hypothetical protein
MKYFIAGIEKHSDKNLQSGSLSDYYELGHECIATHLWAKHLINNGILDTEKDIIVTCEGREFLYNNYIKTITWKDFENINKTQITTSINAVDFFLNTIFQETSFFHDLYNNQGKYKFLNEDYELITNLNFNKDFKIPEEKYICLNRRVRKHREELNMPEDYTINLINSIQENFKVKIYITGYHNDNFNKLSNVTWVSLRDWCTLINNDNCLAVIQNQTGTANLSQLCGKNKLLNLIIDMEMAHFMPIYSNGRRPDVLGKSVNFKNLRNIIFKRLPNINDLINTIKKYEKI